MIPVSTEMQIVVWPTEGQWRAGVFGMVTEVASLPKVVLHAQIIALSHLVGSMKSAEKSVGDITWKIVDIGEELKEKKI